MSHRLPNEQEKLLLRQLFGEMPGSICEDCGGWHWRACPRVKRRAWTGNGNPTEVEYWHQWDDSEVIYPEDVYDTEDDNGNAGGSLPA